MSGANSSSRRVYQPVPVSLLPPLTISNGNEHNTKRLVVDIGRSSIDIDKESLILVRDPPRERLARSRVSAEEHEETLLARVAGKQDIRQQVQLQYPHDYSVLTSSSTSPSSSAGAPSACTTPCTTTPSTPAAHSVSQAEEFYEDIYQYYYDVTKPPSPPPPAADSAVPWPKRDDTSTPRPIEQPPSTMSKRRGSLQAIFVPSFLQSTVTTPPLTPAPVEVSPPSTPGLAPWQGTVNYASRIRALSAAGNANAGAGAAGAETHQRKRSMTFNMSMSLNMASAHSSSSSISTVSSTGIDITSTTHATATTLSPRSSPPPAFLIDDDPFANLTSAPIETMGHGMRFHQPLPLAPPPLVIPVPAPPPPIPRSPLNETPALLPSVASVVGLTTSPLSPAGGYNSLSSATMAAGASPPSSAASSSSSFSSSSSSDATVTSSSSGSSSTMTTPITATPSSSSSSPPSHPAQAAHAQSSPSHVHLPPSSSISSLSPSSSSSLTSLSKTPSLSAPSSPPAPPPQRTRPAYQRPAFSPRPSLPSLDTLARMNVVLTKKVRKGRVGAGLPFEPWDLPSDDEYTPPPPPPPSASTSNANSNAPTPIIRPATLVHSLSASAAMMTTTSHGTDTGSSNLSAELNVNANPDVSASASASGPVPANPSPPSIATPTPTSAASTLVSPSPSPPPPPPPPKTSLSLSLSPAPSRSISPTHSPPYLQLLSHPSPSSSSSSSSTPPATSSTFATASTRGYSTPPPPMSMPIARPQPLLPSQILALGSVAADVELVLPAYPVRSESGRVSEGFDYAWTKPVSRPSSGMGMRVGMRAESQSYSPAPVVHGQPYVDVDEGLSVDVDADAEVPDGYFGDLLDRYQQPSRVPSEDDHDHGQENGHEEGAYARKSGYGGIYEEVAEKLAGRSEQLSAREDGAGVDTGVVGGERNSFAAEYSYLYSSGNLDNNDGVEGDEGEACSSSRSGPGAPRPDSAVFSSPPLSASLTRSFSMGSNSSMDSMDSVGAVEHAVGEEDGERALGEMWSYRRFADPSQSLSSLELDLEGEGGREGGQDGLSGLGYDVNSTEGDERGRGDSTRSSSSHPSLSRTRSSSDDSDALHSPTPGDHDYTCFPYSHARTLARFYQTGYSALFSQPVVSEEDGPSFDSGPAGHGLPTSSSVEEVGAGVVGWGGAFMAEPERGISMPGGLAADTDGEGGFGFGFDKVIVAAEEQDDVVKEKESLATTTSIDVDRPTSTVPTEADLQSASSFDQHDLSLSASTNLSFVEPEISPLVSESDSVAQPTFLTSDDETMSRSNVMPTGASARLRTTTMRPRTSDQPNDSTGYRARGHSSTSSTSQPYRSGSSHAQTANNNTYFANYHSMGSRDNRSGRRRDDSEDEDGEEERRRRRALEQMYANDGMAKMVSSSSSEDDGADNYGEPSVSSTKNHLAPRNAVAGSTISRSPSITGSFVTASSRSPSLKPMDFPASSKHSSRYVTEDEREEEDSDSDDDDVPLAHRIPGALTAQKTIRRQFREEREQRKREKTWRMENGNAERRARQVTLRPAGAGMVSQNGNVAGSSFHDAAILAASSANAVKRQRTTTLPGKSPTSATFNPHDLTRKLQNVQLAEVSIPAYQQHQKQQQFFLLQQQQQQQQQQLALSASHFRSKSISRPSADQQPIGPSYPVTAPLASSPATRSRSVRDPASQEHRRFPPSSPIAPANVPPVPTLRPMRSFHRSSDHHRSVGADEPRAVVPAAGEQRLGRAVTSATRNHRSVGVDESRSGAVPADAEHRLGRSATTATRNPQRRSPSQSRTSGDRAERSMEPVPPLPANINARTSHDDPRKTHKMSSTEPRISSSRTSGDAERAPRSTSIQPPPMPALVSKVTVAQQRVFVGNLQQFHMVEIGPSTTAGDVVAMMEAEGALNGWAGSGGWMVFEIAQDFGMERPIRSYELLADVQSSWLKDKSVNYFVLKLTPLAIPLSRNAIPTSSPTHSSYIEWEAKRGKWSKRWLSLREHNLYLAKRDNGKDEVLICSLSNFDAYSITRAHRAPKPFAFAIKSTDNLSFFENTADYLHTFSCSEKDGKVWMEKILVARSYVLHQERHILFNPKPTSNNASAAVTRSGTKKYAPVRSAQQPLVALPPIGIAQSLPHHDVFEPGSLLAKHL